MRPPTPALPILRPRPAALLSDAGLLAYALYPQLRFGNPLAFLDAQAGWDQGVGPASGLKPAFLLGGPWREYGCDVDVVLRRGAVSASPPGSLPS